MEINKEWLTIKKHVKNSFKSNLHVSIASVNEKNEPVVTPIGTLFLNDDLTGFYFEKFTLGLSNYSDENNKVCVLAVNSNKFFWIKSLFKGRFIKHPALKIYGEFAEKRKATQEEKYALSRRMRNTKLLKEHRYLWNNMDSVRVIKFTKVEAMKLGEMSVVS